MSLPSILIGLAFAAVLATGFITSMGSTSDTARVNNVKVFFIDGMNNAITQCYLAASSFTGCDKTKLTSVGKISTKNQKTEWNDIWTATAESDKVTIVYPLDAASEKDSKGASLVTSLNASNAPVTASYDNATDDLTVIYKF
jgi:type II secretory pathway pseudopilin PulG